MKQTSDWIIKTINSCIHREHLDLCTGMISRFKTTHANEAGINACIKEIAAAYQSKSNSFNQIKNPAEAGL